MTTNAIDFNISNESIQLQKSSIDTIQLQWINVQPKTNPKLITSINRSNECTINNRTIIYVSLISNVRSTISKAQPNAASTPKCYLWGKGG